MIYALSYIVVSFCLKTWLHEVFINPIILPVNIKYKIAAQRKKWWMIKCHIQTCSHPSSAGMTQIAWKND